MTEKCDVLIKVIYQKGHCDAGHKIGDEWLMQNTTPGGICLGAYQSLYPDARVLMYGGGLPWSDDPDSCLAACPDAENPVVFQIRRVRSVE